MSVLRILAAIAAVLMSGYLGFAASEKLKKRAEQLSLLLVMLDEMSSALRYRAVRTDDMIKALGEQSSLADFSFLRELNMSVEKGAPLREAWRLAAENTEAFNEGDRDILFRLGERLGATDTEGQLSLIALSREFTGRNLCEAREEYRIRGGIFKKTGFLCGAALGVLIL